MAIIRFIGHDIGVGNGGERGWKSPGLDLPRPPALFMGTA